MLEDQAIQVIERAALGLPWGALPSEEGLWPMGALKE